MSIWTTVVGLFTGGDKTADLVHDTVRGIGTWIDEQQLTDEERLKVSIEMVGKYNQFLDSTLSENTERSKTRRKMAIFVIRLEAAFLVLSLVMIKFDPSISEYAYKIAVDSPWGILTMGVSAFFFGSHMLRGTALKDKNS